MSRCRGLRRPGSRWCRNIALRKPYRPTEFPRRDIDEHQIHRPLPEPVLPHCLLPARQRDLLAAELTNPRPFDVDLAPMEANLPLRVPPAIPAPALSTRVARPAKFLSLLFHHRRKRLEAGRQAEPLEAGRYLIPSLTHSPRIYRRQGSLCCATSLHGVAFLCGIKHPEPTGSRRATPLLLFQHSPGQFLFPANIVSSAFQADRRLPAPAWGAGLVRPPNGLSLTAWTIDALKAV